MNMRKLFAIAILLALFAGGCRNKPVVVPTPQPEKKTDARQFYKDNADKITKLCVEWEPNADFYYTHYALIDLDSDGIEELYISQDDSPYGWLLCCGGDSLQVITSEDENFHISYLGNIVEMSGMFPSGAAFTKYFDIENSRVSGPDFMGKGQKDFITNELIINFYYLNDDDVPYPVEKTKPFKDKVTKLRTSGKTWIPFKDIELEENPLGVFLGFYSLEDPDEGFWTTEEWESTEK